MTGGNSQSDFLPLLYSLFKGMETFNSSLKEYEGKFKDDPASTAIKDAIKEFQENYDSSIDGLINDVVPEKYKPVARVVKNWPWSDTVDLVSSMLKEYGKDESGGYKTSGEVFRDFLGKKLREKIFKG